METTQLIVFGENRAALVEVSALLPTHIEGICVSDSAELVVTLQAHSPAALIMIVPATGAPPDLTQLDPYLTQIPLILVTLWAELSTQWMEALMPYKPRALFRYPFNPDQLIATLTPITSPDLEATLAEANRKLNARIQEINTIYTVGKSVAASLDIAEILERIITPAVNLTRAESGFVILREGDRLFIRAIKHHGAAEIELPYTPTSDKIAWQVILSGRPAMLHRDVHIATDLLVRAFLYVPLHTHGADISGVLAMVNWKTDKPFTENQLFALSSIADFAAVALENARLFELTEAAHSRLTAILQNAAESIIVTDPEDRLWLWSDAAARLFDIPPTAQGERLVDRVNNEDLQELFSQATPDNSFAHVEIVLDNGIIYNAQVSAIEGIGRIAVMQDITHLKELDRLKSEFVSTVSHDLRTPLTAVQGYIALLERAGPLNELQSQFVNTALNSLDHITSMISDLLDIARTEVGYDLDMKPLRLDRLVEAAVAESQVDAFEAGIEVTFDAAPSLLWVRGNGRRLRQVIDNLISNGIKYNRKNGWVRLMVKQDSDYAIVSISDSGIGIAEEEQSKIFERFYRVKTADTENIEGTGLGLAIVKSVIEKHKGRIWVQSNTGKGSTFTFVLPMCEAIDENSQTFP